MYVYFVIIDIYFFFACYIIVDCEYIIDIGLSTRERKREREQ